LANQLEKELLSPQAKQAWAYEQAFVSYSQKLANGELSAKEKGQFEAQTAALAKEPLAMNYLKHKNPELAIKVEQMAKEHEKQLERSLTLSRGFSRGF